MVKDGHSCPQFPDDQATIVRSQASQDIEKLRSNFLLDAIERNREGRVGRLFDQTLVSNSPTKT